MAFTCDVCKEYFVGDELRHNHMKDDHTPEGIFEAGRKTGHDRGRLTFANTIAAVALLVSITAAHIAYTSADYARVSSRAADKMASYATENEERLKWDRSHEYANKVYLGEAPPYAYKEFGKRGDGITMVVMNASGVEISDVWIESENGLGIKIVGIQRCTLYTVPPTTKDLVPFVPKAVHFADTNGHWVRTSEGELREDTDSKGIPAGVEFGPDAEHGGSLPMDVADCSG